VFDDLLSRLTVVVKFPMTGRVFIGGIQDGFFKESIVHVWSFSSAAICLLGKRFRIAQNTKPRFHSFWNNGVLCRIKTILNPLFFIALEKKFGP